MSKQHIRLETAEITIEEGEAGQAFVVVEGAGFRMKMDTGAGAVYVGRDAARQLNEGLDTDEHELPESDNYLANSDYGDTSGRWAGTEFICSAAAASFAAGRADNDRRRASAHSKERMAE